MNERRGGFRKTTALQEIYKYFRNMIQKYLTELLVNRLLTNCQSYLGNR